MLKVNLALDALAPKGALAAEKAIISRMRRGRPARSGGFRTGRPSCLAFPQ